MFFWTYLPALNEECYQVISYLVTILGIFECYFLEKINRVLFGYVDNERTPKYNEVDNSTCFFRVL